MEMKSTLQQNELLQTNAEKFDNLESEFDERLQLAILKAEPDLKHKLDKEWIERLENEVNSAVDETRATHTKELKLLEE
jgi:hypothetical protein